MKPKVLWATEEGKRLDEAEARKAHWRRWGPYLSERQWGTVREDYSDNGDAWNYFTHDQARSRAYRGGRTDWEEFATITRSCVLRWPSE